MEESKAAALYEAGHAAWPAIELDRAAFARHLSARAPDARPEHAADLYLACACVQGAPGAVEAFDRMLAGAVAGTVARVDSGGAFLDEVLQILRERLLVRSAEGEPKLAEYAGRAALRTWLCTAAARMALNQKRAARDKPHEELASQIASGPGTPELDYAKAQCKRELHGALRAALDRVDARERELLSLHLVDGETLDGLAVRYKVGRATIARWLAAARKKLLGEVREELCRRARITSSEYDSMVGFVRSQLGASVVDLLKQRVG